MKRLYRFRKDGTDVIKEELAVLENGTDWAAVNPNQIIGYDADGNALVPINDVTLNTVNVAEELHVLGLTLLDDDVIVGQGLTVRGDLVVDGVTYTTAEESLDTTADYVVLRQSNSSGLGANEKSGLVVHNYAAGKSAAIGVDRDGTFRVSDNATESNTTYTSISSYSNKHYQGLTQDAEISLVHGAIVSQDIDGFEEVVYVSDSKKYYKYDSVNWYEVQLVNNHLSIDIDNPITDATLLTSLEALPKAALRYARTLTIMTISDTATDTKNIVTINDTDYLQSQPTTEADISGYTRGSTTAIDGAEFTILNDGASNILYAKDSEGKYHAVHSLNGTDWTTDSTPVSDDDAMIILLNMATFYTATVSTATKTTINNQPLMTRSEEADLKDGQLLVWDASAKKAVAFKEPSKKNQTIVSGKDVNDEWTYNWGAGAGSGGTVAHFATMAEWEAARAIAEGEDGYLADNSLVIIDEEADYLTGEEQ